MIEFHAITQSGQADIEPISESRRVTVHDAIQALCIELLDQRRGAIWRITPTSVEVYAESHGGTDRFYFFGSKQEMTSIVLAAEAANVISDPSHRAQAALLAVENHQ